MDRRKTLSLLGLGLLLAALFAFPGAAFASEGGGGGNAFAPLAPLVIGFPLIGFLVNVAFGRRLGEPWAGILASVFAGLAFLIAVLQVVGLASSGYAAVTVPVADWIVIGSVNIPWAIQVDTLSVTMMLVVAGVGTLIHVFAIGYMHGDVRVNGDPARFPRFFVYMNLFLVAMLILVAGDSYMTMFVGWEGVGLCSYLLIGFWFDKGANRIANARAARKAFVVNRIGDWALMMAMFLIFWNFGSFTYEAVFAQAAAMTPETTVGLMTVITLLLLVGATGKSAQIPLYVWLPDAMAGPTPVSALIHAATMVTAGIYMITRSHALFALAPISMNTVAWIGAATALFAGTIGIAQFDIKRVLAYSTISQLGFMVAAVGLGGYVAGMFHLVTHAFFKALLFLSSGSVIHALEEGHHAMEHAAHAHGGGDSGHSHAEHAPPHAEGHTASPEAAHAFDPQDMRNMGGLWGKLPVTKWVYLIGALALAGIVPFAGFWSKDEILLDAFKHNPAVYGLLTVAAFFTAFYMTRQMYLVFFGKPRTEPARHAVESPAVMTIPLILLAALSVLGGALNLPSIAGWTPPGAHIMTEWLGHTLGGEEGGEHGEAVATEAHSAEAAHSEGAEIPTGVLNFQVAGISTLLALVAFGFGYTLYHGNKPATTEERDPLDETLGLVFTGANRKWWVDEFYEWLILNPFGRLSTWLADVIDWNFWHDWFHDTVLAGIFNTTSRLLAQGADLGGIDAMANGLGDLAKGIAGGFRRFQSGYVRAYALMVFLGVVVVLGYFLVVR